MTEIFKHVFQLATQFPSHY